MWRQCSYFCRLNATWQMKEHRVAIVKQEDANQLARCHNLHRVQQNDTIKVINVSYIELLNSIVRALVSAEINISPAVDNASS